MDTRPSLRHQDVPAQRYQTVPSAGQASHAQPDGATAPPADMMDKVPGYEGMGAGGFDLPYQGPPQAPDPGNRGPTMGVTVARHGRIPTISEEEAQEAFLEYASSNCCYSKKPARDMVFTDLQAHNPYRYRLETFAESRSTEWASEPYTGQMVDGYMGVAPGPWNITVPIPSLFQKSQKDVRIPHTSSVKGCHACMTLGRIPCRRCVTSGMEQCPVCNGSGRRSSEDRCVSCGGSGRRRCTNCSGAGTHICKTCQGRGQLLCFIKLVVKWNNYVYESVVDNHSDLPMDLVSGVTGKILFTNMQPVVYPVSGVPNSAINQVSERAVREHQAQYFTTSRIIQQRQTIELIHVTRVCYTWQDKTHVYFVYGAEHKVHTDDYPAKCCCTIL